MKNEILRLANHLDSLGLYDEADLCDSVLRKIGKGSDAQGDPYGSIATPMSPLAWLDEPCTHDFDADECPVCGKRLK